MGQDIRQEVLPPEGMGSTARRWRRDGWTPHKMQAFLEGLAQLGSVRDACRAVGLSKTSAYRLYEQDPGFAAAWERALTTIRPSLEETAYQRAVVGWEEPVFHGGKLVGHRRRFSDSLLRLLIERGFNPSATAAATAHANEDVLAALGRKLTAMENQVARKRRAEQLRGCETMEREGKAP